MSKANEQDQGTTGSRGGMIDSLSSRFEENAETARVFGLGLIVGALAGAAAGLLMAPASGPQTRKMIRKGARRALARTGDAWGSAIDGADRGYRSAGKMGSRGLKQARRKAMRAREMAEDMMGRKSRRFSWR